MQFNSKIPQVLAKIEQRAVQALDRVGRDGVSTAASGTPVDTGFARRSVHRVVKDATGAQVAGQSTDGNGYPVPGYPVRPRPTVFVGSNTAERPDNFTGPGGYYLGLELGLFSRKGQNMLMSAFTVMLSEIEAELRNAMV
jgi:hypothetical protein